MAYWILKTEPSSYSFERLVKDQGTSWDGVRNYQARNNLALMAPGDSCFIYHSVGPREIVGSAKVTKSAYPDSTASGGKWLAVDLVPEQALKNPVTLAQIKAETRLADISLVRQGRLSVCPIGKKEWELILEMSQQD